MGSKDMGSSRSNLLNESVLRILKKRACRSGFCGELIIRIDRSRAFLFRADLAHPSVVRAKNCEVLA